MNTNPDSAQFQHQTPYFKVTSRLQNLTKVRETGAKTSKLLLANHSNKVHLIPSYRERVITVLVKPCPKTRNQNAAENYQTSNVFSESITTPNHTKFVPKLKGIE